MPRVSLIDSHTPFAIGDLEIHPYPVPHDAREPSQFVFSDGDLRLGLLTDTGDSTPHIERMLSGIDALVLECNHDLELLMNGPYPPTLKRRISGRYGHLDNATAARILGGIDCSRLQHFIAAHLSAQNNTPELARVADRRRSGASLPGSESRASRRDSPGGRSRQKSRRSAGFSVMRGCYFLSAGSDPRPSARPVPGAAGRSTGRAGARGHAARRCLCFGLGRCRRGRGWRRCRARGRRSWWRCCGFLFFLTAGRKADRKTGGEEERAFHKLIL